MHERFLEKIGILKHHPTMEEVEAGEQRLKELTALYMEGKIELKAYEMELDKLPKLDFVQLAHELKYKG